MKEVVGCDKEPTQKGSGLSLLDGLVFGHHTTLEMLVKWFPVLSPPWTIWEYGHTYIPIHPAPTKNIIFGKVCLKWNESDDTYSSLIIVICFLSE